MQQQRWRFAVLVVLLLAAGVVQAQTPARLAAETVEKIERAVTAHMSRLNIPGLSVAVVTDGQLRWSNGYGLADLENFVPAKAATVYRLASISKTITATAAMQLAERGQLDLDAPVQKYCPAFPQKQWPVTTRQLLGHLGGVRHYREGEIESTRHYASIPEPLDIFKNDPLLHEPGTRYAYSTYGYNVLGCVVEGAAGTNFVAFVTENIFRPARMERIRPDDVFEIIPNRAQGYRRTPAGLRNSVLADTSNKIPGGGFCSTVEDLSRFAIAVQSAALVKKETLEQMWTRQRTRDGQQTNYGLGWFLSERNGRREVAHSGGQPRVSTYLYMLPEKGLAVVLMSNLEGAGLAALAREIADIVSPEPQR